MRSETPESSQRRNSGVFGKVGWQQIDSLFVSPVLAQMPERGDAWTDVAALSRRVHQIRGSILSDELIDRGSPSDENAWIREARQSVFATCGCSGALDDPMSGWRQRDSRLMHGRPLDISLGRLDPEQGLKAQ